MLSILLNYFGRVHPLVVHFPIALLVLGAGVEGLRLVSQNPLLGKLNVFLLSAGAAGAVVAAVAGWVLAEHIHQRQDLRAFWFWHRWLGVATALAALAACFAAVRWMDSPLASRRWMRRGSVWLTAALLTVTAHLGALLVWGVDYFS